MGSPCVGILLNYRLNPLQRQGFALDTDHTKTYHGLPRKISTQALSNDEALDFGSRNGV
jgi:hypothetical protein